MSHPELSRYLHMLANPHPPVRRRQRLRRQSVNIYDTHDAAQVLQHNAMELDYFITMMQRHDEQKPSVAPPMSPKAMSRLAHYRILPVDRELHRDDTQECTVCCERLIDGVALIRLDCGHVFHANCVAPWLHRSCTCPTCRFEHETVHPNFEASRLDRMKGRAVSRCQCPPSGAHRCFFTAKNGEHCAVITGSESLSVAPTLTSKVETNHHHLDEAVRFLMSQI